jgi:hypothetical protein
VPRRGRALLVAVALALPTGLAAQNPPAPTLPVAQPPGARGDSAAGTARAPGRPDSTTPPDSLSPDSFAAVLPPLGPPAGPLPQGTRLVYDREALLMAEVYTLGELLQRVPGVFLVRAGWYGLPEVVHFAGQGAGSVEVYWDGYALDPLSDDSAGLDVGRIAVGLFQRIEVEVLPTVVRVYLVSDTQPVRRARTETSFGTGDAATNTYRIRYLNRWAGGVGAALGVNWFGTSGQVSTPARSSDLTLWAKGTWAPTDRVGIEWQYVRYSLDRAPLGTVLPGRRLWRSDSFFRAFAATRSDGMGFRFDALFGTSSAGDSSTAAPTSIAQGGAFAGYRSARWSVETGVRVRDTRIPLEIEARAAAMPLRMLTLEVSAVSRSLLGHRSSSELSAGAALRPLGPLQLHGAVRLRDAVAEPALLADTAQRVADWSAGLALLTRRLQLDVSLARHGAFAAPVYGSLAAAIPAGTALGLRTVTVAASYRPKPYLTVEGWYREPLVPSGAGGAGTAAYEPPHHTRVTATFRSKFLPTFRRGALDVLVQVAGEGWSDGVMGTGAGGTPIALDGHGTVDWLVELRLLGAVIYWSLGNSQVERYETVPGAPMARASQRYGVLWQFTN